MRELAVQSSSDTNTDDDRKEIQGEMNQLSTEISRISKDTKFNTKGLLDGSLDSTIHIGANKGENIKIDVKNMSAEGLNVSGGGAGKANYAIKGGTDGTETMSTIASFDGLAITEGENKLNVVKLDNSVNVGTATESSNYGLANNKGEIVAVSNSGKDYEILTKATRASDLGTAAKADTTNAKISFEDTVISGEEIGRAHV